MRLLRKPPPGASSAATAPMVMATLAIDTLNCSECSVYKHPNWPAWVVSGACYTPGICGNQSSQMCPELGIVQAKQINWGAVAGRP